MSTAPSVNSFADIKSVYEKCMTERSNYYRCKLMRPCQCVLAKNQPGMWMQRWADQVEADGSLAVKAN